MKKIVLMLFAVLMIAIVGITSFANGSSDSGSPSDTYEWSFGLNGGNGSIEYDMALLLKQKLEEKSDGKIILKLYPDGQLGDDTAMFEMLADSQIDIALGVSDRFQQWVPRLEALGLPYIYDSYEHVKRFWSSPAGQKAIQELESILKAKDIGIGYNGVRHVSSNKKITSLADMKGLKLRVPNNAALLKFAELSGANPTPISFAEVYLSLQTNVVDAQENPLPTIKAKKFYEVQKYIALTGHMLNDVHYFVSKKSFDNLSPGLQTAVLEAGQEVAAAHAKAFLDQEKELISFFESEGLEITKPDRTEFRNAMRPYYAEYENKFGDSLIKAIDEVR